MYNFTIDKELIIDIKNKSREIKQSVDNSWNENIESLQDMIETNSLYNFLKWPVIRKTMFVGNNGAFVNFEYQKLVENEEWNPRWKNAVIENNVGNPDPYVHNLNTSCNLVHHAYWLSFFELLTKKNINSFETIFEFGGGYGSMCRLAYQAGFTGKYIIYDFEVFNLLQEFYLKSINMDMSKINIINKEKQFDHLYSHEVKEDKSLFISTWGISETPTGLKKLFFDKIKDFNSFLICYQDVFDGFDNNIFLRNWKRKIERYWHQEHMEHLPCNRYLIGTK